MELTRGFFPKLLVGTFAVSILAFMIRGFGQLLLGSELARLLAAPVFVVAISMAVVSFVLSLLVTLGFLGETVE